VAWYWQENLTQYPFVQLKSFQFLVFIKSKEGTWYTCWLVRRTLVVLAYLVRWEAQLNQNRILKCQLEGKNLVIYGNWGLAGKLHITTTSELEGQNGWLYALELCFGRRTRMRFKWRRSRLPVPAFRRWQRQRFVFLLTIEPRSFSKCSC